MPASVAKNKGRVDRVRAQESFFSWVFVDLGSLLRPREWLKNVFVLMPVPFALAGNGVFELSVITVGLLAMSLASSAVYTFNDVTDREHDRADSKKRVRAVASGRVSVAAAITLSSCLALGAVFLAVVTHREQVVTLITLYLVLGLFYCLRGREIPLVDVFVLAAGFVIRLLLGCALVSVAASNWLLFCGSSLALFLVLAKRHADVAQHAKETYRASLSGYRLSFLEQSQSILAATVIVSYAMYCVDGQSLVEGREFFSVPFVAFGVLEYLRASGNIPLKSSPIDILLTSPRLMVCGFGWFVSVCLSLPLRYWS